MSLDSSIASFSHGAVICYNHMLNANHCKVFLAKTSTLPRDKDHHFETHGATCLLCPQCSFTTMQVSFSQFASVANILDASKS